MPELIKEIREDIATHIKQYKASDVTSLFYVFAKMISVNEDFRLVAVEGEKEAIEIIEEEIGKKPECSLFSELSEESVLLLREVMDIELHNKKVTKKRAVEIISQALADDIIFEGICLSSFVDDMTLAEVMETFGCPNRYEFLMQDKVYLKRRKYVRKIFDYTLAAVNLYGVIHIRELMVIMESFEKWPASEKDYRKKDGTYRVSTFYSPEYYSLYVLHHVIGDDVPVVEATMSGFVLNHVFAGSTVKEIEGLGNYAKKHGIRGDLSEDELRDYFDSAGHLPYRRLHETVIAKEERYIPSKKEFLKYADEYYIEETEASRRLTEYVKRTFKADIRAVSEEDGGSEDEVVDEIVSNLQMEAMDRSEDYDDRNPTDLVQYAFQMLEEEYDIKVDGIDQANEFLKYLMELANSTRLWINGGYTPNELRDISEPYPGPTTIVPASSNAAKLLGEAAPQIRQMGFNVDLDSNASEIPTYAYEQGIGGPVTKSVKKVYPNDPCPCGSGKKYKKCCGRNK